MTTPLRKLGAMLFAGLLIAALPASAHAQDSGPPYPLPDDTYSLDLYGGLDVPVQDLMDAFDPGATVGLSFARRVHHDVNLRLDAGATFYTEDEYDADRVGPSATMFRFAIGPEVNLFDPKLTKWAFLVNAGVGWSFMKTDGLADDCEGICETGVAVKTGFKATYPVSSSVDLFAGAEGWWYFLEDNENGLLRRFEERNPRELKDPEFTNSWTFPIIAGLRLNF